MPGPTPEENRAIQARRMAAKRAKRRQYVTRRSLYDNCLVLSPEGEMMFRCRRGRFDWYLSNTHCEKVGDDPPTLRLKFEPRGPGYIGDPYHLQERDSRCVVCGETRYLTRHHVLPKLFRRHYPMSYVRRCGHDVLPICTECHDRYETLALRKKKEIAAENGVPYYSRKVTLDPRLLPVIKTAWTLHRHGPRIPRAKKEPLVQVLREYLGKDAITAEDLDRIRTMDGRCDNPNYVDIGRYVVQRVDLEGFLIDWRQHFVKRMRPRFLPSGWDPRRPLAKDLERTTKPWPWVIARERKDAGAPPDAPWWTFVSGVGHGADELPE